jgi:hypothetical protein
MRHAFGTAAANPLLAKRSSASDASRLLMAIMGHTEVKTSARYVLLAAEGLEGIVRRIPAPAATTWIRSGCVGDPGLRDIATSKAIA